MNSKMYMIGIGVLMAPIAFLLLSSSTPPSRDFVDNNVSAKMNIPPCVEMHNCIERYAEKYNIPKRYAYGIAWKETRYNGAFHWGYNPGQTSCAGAVGPMQVMYSTAKMMWRGKSFTKEELKTNVDFNVETSMKLLRHLHDTYGDWKIVFGCYNTGKPMVNQYAVDVYNFK